MKFTLPSGTFPPLELSREDMDNMDSVAALLVDAAVAEYHAFRRASKRGVADRERWKPLKHRDGINVFHERVATTPTIRKRKQAGRHQPTGAARTGDIESLLAVGCVPGNLEDALLGLLNLTKDQAIFKSASTSDGLSDSVVLATIVPPTTANPLRGLAVKWSAATARASAFMSPVVPVKARDFVYLEATGTAMGEDGEQVGYHLMHSVEIPGVRKLHEHHLVRTNVSICCLLRQKRVGVLEMYVKGCIDKCGLRSGLALALTADLLLSYRLAASCGQMKKLAWMVAAGDGEFKPKISDDMANRASLLSTLTSSYHERPSSESDMSVAKGHRSACSSCQSRLRGSSRLRRRVCEICSGVICSLCAVPCSIHRHTFRRAVDLASGRESTEKQSGKDDRLVMCRRCWDAAERTNPIEVAMDEVHRSILNVSGMDSAMLASATSLFSLINSDRFDSKDFFFNVH